MTRSIPESAGYDQPMTTRVPTITQCLAYMDAFAMLDNIRLHSFMVAHAATALLAGLARAEKTKAPLPASDLVVAGALLHDIAKTQCLHGACKHALVGQEICRDLGFPEIGEIVREHVILSDYAPERYRQGIFNAKELVYYADKRVRHDMIVSLDSRLEYILGRYGNNDPMIESFIITNFKICQEFEHLLFSFLDFPPSNLAQITTARSFSLPLSE
ncbi:MAG: HDIG domain-containing protein [Desulfoprunum sp.]|nr:HDIG domain-containing protein [Desulfoprunum sp.]